MDLERLEQLALAASPGPWEYKQITQVDQLPPKICTANGALVMATWNVLYSNCEFIAAANPAAVLELIAEIKLLRGEKNSCEQAAPAAGNN